MPLTFVPFAGWSPGGSLFGEGWSTAENLYPSFAGWRPLPAFVPSLNSVAFGPMNGAHVHAWSSGVGSTSYVPNAATIYAGSKTRIHTVDPTTGIFTDVSRAANYAAANEPSGWHFATVGNDIWATNHLDVPQRRVNNAGLFTNGVVSAFVPQPRFLAVIREHLIGANLSNGGRRQDEFVWSDADDATNFDPPTGTSISIAGAKALTSIKGQITGLVGGQYGFAFKEDGIFYLEYAGGTAVFRPDVLSPHIGTRYPSSIVNSRTGVYFLGSDGFYRIKGVSEPQKISTPGVDQFLYDSGFTAFTPSTYTEADEDGQMLGFDHPHLSLVGWLYRQELAQFGNDLMLLYNPVLDQWSTATTGGILISAIARRPFAASLFDAVAGFRYNGVSSYYAPLSAAGSVRAPSLQLRFRPANFEASRHQQQTIMKGVLPIFSKTSVSGTALTHSVTVETLLDPLNDVWTAEGPRLASERDTISGMFPFQIAGRFFRISITCAAEDFASFDGVYVDQELL